jgi:hypothetical protein
MSLKRFAFAWTLMWGLSYVVAGILVPEIAGDALTGTITFVVLGALILTALMQYTKFKTVAKVLLYILAGLEVYGGVASWAGLIKWNVPFTDVGVFQVSMAFADLLSAAFMFYLATEEVR